MIQVGKRNLQRCKVRGLSLASILILVFGRLNFLYTTDTAVTVDIVRAGLSTCTALEELKLHISTHGIGYSDDADLQQRGLSDWPLLVNPVDFAPHRSWHTVVGMLNLLPAQCLSRIDLHLFFSLCNIPSPHTLEWDGLREAISRFSNVSFLKIDLKMRDHRHPHQCVMYEMRGFESILQRLKQSARCKAKACLDRLCKEYNTERSSEIQ